MVVDGNTGVFIEAAQRNAVNRLKMRATFSLSLHSEEFTNSSVIYFEHEQLDDLVNELINKGIEFEQLPTDQPYLWKEAILIDPSGNKIKLFWAGKNRLNPPWKVQ